LKGGVGRNVMKVLDVYAWTLLRQSISRVKLGMRRRVENVPVTD